MKIKLTNYSNKFYPNIIFKDDSGNKINNKEKHVVYLEVLPASASEKQDFINIYTMTDSKQKGVLKTQSEYKYEKCLKKKVTNIVGLEDYNIRTGNDLISFGECKEIQEIIHQTFFYINGISLDEEEEEQEEKN